ncbi:MAG: glycosyltransferase [Synechococcaceae cyanobacterium ELA182]
MLRVLHVIPSISPLRGGPSAAVIGMVRALRAQGVDAAILTTNDAGPGLDSSLPIGQWHDHQGVPVLAFKRWSPPITPLREFAISPGLNFWLAGHLHNFDLLHVHALFSWPSTTAMLQARLSGVPYLLRTIGQLCRWSLARSPGRKRLLLTLVEGANLKGAKALHFTSEAEWAEAADLGLLTPTLVLPLGVTVPTPARTHDHALPEGYTAFLFLSRLHPKKRLELLLEALALLQQRQPHAAWQLSIAGDGDPVYVAQLKRQAEVLGLASRCRWLGFVQGAAKWDALRGAHWFVLPSASENFGIAAVEALAVGTPVLVSEAVAVGPEIAAAGAGLLIPADPAALADCLAAAMGGPPAAMVVAAHKLVSSRYDWPAIAQQLERAYLDCLA